MNKSSITNAVKATLSASRLPPEILLSALHDNDETSAKLAGSVIVEPAALQRLLAALRDEREVARLDQSQMTAGIYSGYWSFNMESLAKWIISQALWKKNSEEVVSVIADALGSNSLDVFAVMSLRGVRVTRRTKLGPDVDLVPLAEAPGIMFGVGSPHINMGHPARPSAAIVLRMQIKPLLVSSDAVHTPALNEEFQRKAADCNAVLDEARNCLALVGGNANAYTTWTKTIAAPLGFASSYSWVFSLENRFLPDFELNSDEVEHICQGYFALPHGFRHDVLRTSLDRLNRAARANTLVDRAIDLGIALEALLMHDLNSQGELSYKLRLRAAWIIGGEYATRRRTYDLVNNVYKLRSKSVHTGQLDQTVETATILDEGMKLCSELIMRVIRRGKKIDWAVAVLDGSSEC